MAWFKDQVREVTGINRGDIGEKGGQNVIRKNKQGWEGLFKDSGVMKWYIMGNIGENGVITWNSGLWSSMDIKWT